MSTIIGTDGDDYLFAEEDFSTVQGRGGNDVIELFGGSFMSASGGDGDDRFDIRFSWDNLLTGGSGRDTYAPDFGDFTQASTVTDFTVGDKGDIIDLTAQLGFISQYGYESGNPFTRGIFQWQQQGTSAVLVYDEFWFQPRNRGVFAEVLILENTNVLQLAPENLGGFEPVPVYGYGNKVRGTVDADVIAGTDAADGIIGFAGDDSLLGEAGDDFIQGGAGNDTISGGRGNDRLEGGAGNDHVFDDGESADALYGGAGDDFLNVIGGSGSILEGGSGNDTILVQDADLVRVFGGNGDDLITVEGLYVSHVEGGAGKDTIYGSANDDNIIGGAGADFLGGGEGADAYIYLTASDSLTGRGADRIIGFESGLDTIDLSGIDALTATAADDAFAFIGDAAFTGLGQLRLDTSVAGQVSLTANISGDLRADFQIVFFDGAAPLMTDILI